VDWDWDDGPPQDTPGGAPRDDRRPPEEPLSSDATGSSTFADAIEHFDRSAPAPDDDERTQLIKMPPDSATPPPAGPPSARSDVEPAMPGGIERVRRGTPASAPAAYSTDLEPAAERRPRPPRDRAAARARRRKQIRRRRLVALAVLIAIVVLIVVLVVRGCGGSGAGAGSSAVVIGALFLDRRLLVAAGRR
jgi:hypothetical protein